MERHVQSCAYTYWRCTNCSTSQLHPQPDEEEMSAFYESFHSSEDSSSYGRFETRASSLFARKLKLMRKFVNSNTRLLDVGCGKGFFLSACIPHFHVSGIDISSEATEYASRIFGNNIETIDIQDMGDNPKYFNRFEAITLWATLEHIRDPASALNILYKCLVPGGYLFIDTGCDDGLSEKLLAGHVQWYNAPEHFFVFGEKGLNLLFENCGFRVKYIHRNFESSLFRGTLKEIRHFYLCLSSFLIILPFLGRAGRASVRTGTKWPIGRLLLMVCQKPNTQ